MLYKDEQNNAWQALTEESRKAFMKMYNDISSSAKEDYFHRPYYKKQLEVLEDAFGEENVSGENIGVPPFNVGDKITWKNGSEEPVFSVLAIEQTPLDSQLWIVDVEIYGFNYGWFPASDFKRYVENKPIRENGSKCHIKGREDYVYTVSDYDKEHGRYLLSVGGQPLKWVSETLLETYYD